MTNQETEQLRAERDAAVRMLAYWCVCINRNGTGWDDWDEAYKNADYRKTNPPSLRGLIDAAKKKADEEWDSF